MTLAQLQRPIILCTKREAYLHKNYAKTYMYTLQNTYKKQPNFLQTLFITVLTISFLLLSTSSASVELYKLITLDKMILLAVKLSRLDVSSTQLKQAFNFHSNHLRKKPYLRNV